VLRAVDGYQAVEIMRSEKVDVVLLDLMMPEMNGYQVLAERSQDAALSAIPVILISARDPWGQPIVSKSLAVTCRDGLSVQELLMCIESISAILSKTKPPVDPAPPAALSA
jgi:CheY-like chemotaxis protein